MSPHTYVRLLGSTGMLCAGAYLTWGWPGVAIGIGLAGLLYELHSHR